MAESPVYTTVPGKLPDLLGKIREVGVPAKATTEWLKSIGFKSSNDRSLLNVLRYVGFIDKSGVPTPAWRQYRGSDHKSVLGRAIVLGYQNLYETYSDAHQRPNADIGHVFSTQSNAGQQAIAKMISTFKTLASLAEFDSTVSPIQNDAGPVLNDEVPPVTRQVTATTAANAGLLAGVNVNIQLTLPESADEKFFDAFFASMKRNLLAEEAS